MEYSNSEYCDMLILYGECHQVARATVEEYAVRFPNRRLPDKNVILRLVQRTRETGVLAPTQDNAIGGVRNVRVPAQEEAVLQLVEDDPSLSIRQIARIRETSYATVQRILKENTMHAFHYTRVQSLQAGDYPRRLAFCRWLVGRNAADPNFSSKILFTDESTFGRDGPFNYHNMHFWDVLNPHVTHIRGFQNRFSINVWAGIRGNVLLDLQELPQRLNGENYSQFLEYDLPQKLENAGIADEESWFQHDGAPAHNSRAAREVLDRAFPETWIGRGGPVSWPARSPDLNPLDFFMWGHVKEHLYRGQVNTPEELRARITEAVATITQDMLNRVTENLIRRANLCIEAQGGHFEHRL